jgi:hypothetical protein
MRSPTHGYGGSDEPEIESRDPVLNRLRISVGGA